MSVAIISGSAGLVGAEASRFFASKGLEIVGIDNDMRGVFFGDNASTGKSQAKLKQDLSLYTHFDVDIRDRDEIKRLFKHYGKDISLVIHTAAQPSHDFSSNHPYLDFSVNAAGTLNLLQQTREFAYDATFIYTSTNKVYGDTPNRLPLVENPSRWEINQDHPYWNGIPESMSVDGSVHSLFGVSKLSADLLAQEYGRNFGLRTAIFRGGCLTGPNHSGTELHGFLAYLVKCTAYGIPYKIYGYKGKQVRDNIHSSDLIRAFHEVYLNPPHGEVFNIGGGRFSNISMIEAIKISEEICGRELSSEYIDQNRVGDHIWYISDMSKFLNRYPNWKIQHNCTQIIQEISDQLEERTHPNG